MGQHFCARGYWVLTVGHDEQSVRKYIQKQEEEDKKLEQLNLWQMGCHERWRKT